MNHKKKDIPPLQPQPNVISLCEMATSSSDPDTASSAALSSLKITLPAYKNSEISATTSVHHVAKVTQGTAAAHMSSVFSQVPIMVVNPMQHDMPRNSSSSSSTIEQVVVSSSVTTINSNEPINIQAQGIHQNSGGVLGNFSQADLTSGTFLSNPYVLSHQFQNNVIVAPFVHNGVLQGNMIFGNYTQNLNAPVSIPHLVPQQYSLPSSLKILKRPKGRKKSSVSKSTISNHFLLPKVDIIERDTKEMSASVEEQLKTVRKLPLPESSKEVEEGPSTQHVTKKMEGESEPFHIVIEPDPLFDEKLKGVKLEKTHVTTATSSVNLSRADKSAFVTTSPSFSCSSSSSLPNLSSQLQHMNNALCDNNIQVDLSENTFLPVIENCYSMKKLSLRQMLQLLEKGQNIISYFKPGTKDYNRALVLCKLVVKYGISSMRSDIPVEFYTSLVGEHISLSEAVALKICIDNNKHSKENENEIESAGKSQCTDVKIDLPENIWSRLKFPIRTSQVSNQIKAVLKDFQVRMSGSLEQERKDGELIRSQSYEHKQKETEFLCTESEENIPEEAELIKKAFTLPIKTNESDTACSSEITDASTTGRTILELLTSCDETIEILDDLDFNCVGSLDNKAPTSFHLRRWRWIMLADIEEYNDDQSYEILCHCYLCGLLYPSIPSVWQHIIKEHAKNALDSEAYPSFTCTHCDTTYRTFRNLRQHEITIHLCDYPCFFCGFSFEDRFDMLQHIATGHSQMYTCKTCHGQFFGIEELGNHCKWLKHNVLMDRSGKLSQEIMCLFCNENFRENHDLVNHLNRFHIDTLEEISCGTVCSSCRHPFLDVNALSLHRSLSSRRHKAERYVSKTSLKTLAVECFVNSEKMNACEDKKKKDDSVKESVRKFLKNESPKKFQGYSEVRKCLSSLVYQSDKQSREITVSNLKYKYPIQELYEYCGFGESFPLEFKTWSMDELVELMIMDFPGLLVDKTTSDLQDLLLAISRSHKFVRILLSRKLCALPWNGKIQACVKLFIDKVKDGRYKLIDTNPLSVLVNSLKKSLAYFKKKQYKVISKLCALKSPEDENTEKDQQDQYTMEEMKKKLEQIAMETNTKLSQNIESGANVQKDGFRSENMEGKNTNLAKQRPSTCQQGSSEGVKIELAKMLRKSTSKGLDENHALGASKADQEKDNGQKVEIISNKALLERNSNENDATGKNNKRQLNIQTEFRRKLRQRKSSVTYRYDGYFDETGGEDSMHSSSDLSESDDDWRPHTENCDSALSDEEQSECKDSTNVVVLSHSEKATGCLVGACACSHSFESTCSNCCKDSFISEEDVKSCSRDRRLSHSKDANIFCEEKADSHSKVGSVTPSKEQIHKNVDLEKTMNVDKNIKKKSILPFSTEPDDKNNSSSLTDKISAQNMSGQESLNDSSSLNLLKVKISPDNLKCCTRNILKPNKSIKCSYVKIERNKEADCLSLCLERLECSQNSKAEMGVKREYESVRRGRGRPRKHPLDNNYSSETEKKRHILSWTKRGGQKKEGEHDEVNSKNLKYVNNLDTLEGTKEKSKSIFPIDKIDEGYGDCETKKESEEKDGAETLNKCDQRSLNSDSNTLKETLIKSKSIVKAEIGKHFRKRRKRTLIEVMEIENSNLVYENMLRPRKKRNYIEKDSSSDSENIQVDSSDDNEHQFGKLANNEVHMTQALDNKTLDDMNFLDTSNKNIDESSESNFVITETKRMLSKMLKKSERDTETKKQDELSEHIQFQNRSSSLKDNAKVIDVNSERKDKALVIENKSSSKIKDEKEDPDYLKALSDKTCDTAEKATTDNEKILPLIHSISHLPRILPKGKLTVPPELLSTLLSQSPVMNTLVHSVLDVKQSEALVSLVSSTSTCASTASKVIPTKGDLSNVIPGKECLKKKVPPCLLQGQQNTGVIRHPVVYFPGTSTVSNSGSVEQQTQPNSSTSSLTLVPISGTNQFILVNLSTDQLGNVTHNGQPVQKIPLQHTKITQNTQDVKQSQSPFTQKSHVLLQPQMMQQTPVIQSSQAMQQIHGMHHPQIVHPTTALQQMQMLQHPQVMNQTQMIQQTQMVQQTPMMQQTQMIQQTPVLQQTPIMQQTPMFQQTSIIQPTTMVQQTPMLQQTPLIQHKPIVQQTPIQQTPILQQTPMMQQTPTIQQPLMIQQSPMLKPPMLQQAQMIKQPGEAKQTSIIQPTQQVKPSQSANYEQGIHWSSPIPQQSIISEIKVPNRQCETSQGQTSSDFQCVTIKQEADTNVIPDLDNSVTNQISVAGLMQNQFENLDQSGNIIARQRQMRNIELGQQLVPIMGPQGSIQTLMVPKYVQLAAGQFIYVPPQTGENMSHQALNAGQASSTSGSHKVKSDENGTSVTQDKTQDE